MVQERYCACSEGRGGRTQIKGGPGPQKVRCASQQLDPTAFATTMVFICPTFNVTSSLGAVSVCHSCLCLLGSNTRYVPLPLHFAWSTVACWASGVPKLMMAKRPIYHYDQLYLAIPLSD